MNKIFFTVFIFTILLTIYIYADDNTLSIKRISSSSELKDAIIPHRYNAWKAVDGIPETCWVEGKGDAGTGEYLEVTFENIVSADKILILPGLFDAKQYTQNNRVKRIGIYLDDYYLEAELEDGMKKQTIPLNGVKTFKHARFIIKAVYKGSTWDNTGISELEFYVGAKKLFIQMTTWQRMIGGSGGDLAYSIQQTADGGYIVAGYSNSTDIPGIKNYGMEDYYVIKLDSLGNTVWERMIGGSNDDYAYSIQQTADGGYIVAGYSNSTDIPGLKNHGDSDYYIIKLDGKGNTVWQRMFGGNDRDNARLIQQTVDGGYIVAGYSESTNIPGLKNHGVSDFYIMKLDREGNTVWQSMIGGSNADLAESIQQTADGGYIVAGCSGSNDIPGLKNHGTWDYYIIKLDSLGNILWQRMVGGSGLDSAESIQQTVDGGYIVAGWSKAADIPGLKNHGVSDFYIMKLDREGNTVWQRMIGGSSADVAVSIQQTADGGYIIAGFSESTDIPGLKNHGVSDFYIVKLDNLGNTVWQRMIGGSGIERTYSIQQHTDGGYISAGNSCLKDIPGLKNHGDWDYYIIKLDAMGNLEGLSLSIVFL